MENLLHQYKVVSAHAMPNDLVVSMVFRCMEPMFATSFWLTLDDSIDCNTLKEKLILMDKNSRV